MKEPCQHEWEVNYPVLYVVDRESGLHYGVEFEEYDTIPPTLQEALDTYEGVTVVEHNKIEFRPEYVHQVTSQLYLGDFITERSRETWPGEWDRAAKAHTAALDHLNQQ